MKVEIAVGDVTSPGTALQALQVLSYHSVLSLSSRIH